MELHRVEVVTTLGDTCVERTCVGDGARIGDFVVRRTPTGFVLRCTNGNDYALPRRLPYGLGAIEIRAVPRPRRTVPRPVVDRRVIAFLGCSLAAHFTVLAFASMKPIDERPPPRTQGAPRPRLVANHTTMTRAQPSAVVVPSTHDLDQPEQQPTIAPGTMTRDLPDRSRVASQMMGPQPQDISASTPKPSPKPSVDPKKQTGEEAARHFDPCASGDCGLIATTRFATTSHGKQAGDDFKLPPRDPRTLAMSVVECSVDGGCSTVSGTDQDDIRAAIGKHIAEVDACFDQHPDTSASVDAQVGELGTVRVSAHDARAASNCIADVIAKLEFSRGERDVTLAFSAPRR
jgi:hypothetical protein